MVNDFISTQDRARIYSSKWLRMLAQKPEVKEGIIPLSLADMEFKSGDFVKEAISNYVQDNVLGYTRPSSDYLDSVVNFFKDYHKADIDAKWVITTPGIVSALASSVRAYTKEGDGVIIFTPIYNPFYDVIEGQNRRMEEIPLIYKDNSYQIDFEKFEEVAKKEDVKLILFCSPHNPGGKVWSKADIEKVGKIAMKNNLLIVSDEIHSDYVHKGRHFMITQIKEIRDICICCTAASKTFNLAGLQCSNILIPDEELRNKFLEINKYAGVERANILGMIATEAAYTKGMDWLFESKEVIVYNIKVVNDFFEDLSAGFRVMSTDAGFLVWINYEEVDLSKKDLYEIFYEADFFITKGEVFGDGGDGFIRLNVGLPTKDLQLALKRFEDCFKSRIKR